MYNNFADAIRIKRKEKKYSLVKLSELTDITPSYINRLEKSERKNPKLDICIKLVKALNINVLDIKETSDIKEFLDILASLYKKDNSQVLNTLNKTSENKFIDPLQNLINFIEYTNFNQLTNLQEIEILFKLINNYKSNKNLSKQNISE